MAGPGVFIFWLPVLFILSCLGGLVLWLGHYLVSWKVPQAVRRHRGNHLLMLPFFASAYLYFCAVVLCGFQLRNGLGWGVGDSWQAPLRADYIMYLSDMGPFGSIYVGHQRVLDDVDKIAVDDQRIFGVIKTKEQFVIQGGSLRMIKPGKKPVSGELSAGDLGRLENAMDYYDRLVREMPCFFELKLVLWLGALILFGIWINNFFSGAKRGRVV